MSELFAFKLIITGKIGGGAVEGLVVKMPPSYARVAPEVARQLLLTAAATIGQPTRAEFREHADTAYNAVAGANAGLVLDSGLMLPPPSKGPRS